MPEALNVFIHILPLAMVATGTVLIAFDMDRTLHDKTYNAICHSLVVVGGILGLITTFIIPI